MERRLLVDYIFPIVSCLVISLGFVRLFILGGLDSTLHGSSSGAVEQVVWTVSLSLVGILGVVLLYWLAWSRRGFEARVLIALVVAPTSAILVVIVSQTVLMVVAKAVSSWMTSIVVLVSLYISVFSMIFIISNAFSTRTRSFVFIVYGSLLGSFISLVLPTVSLIVMLVVVAVFDLVLLNTRWVMDAVKVFGGGRRSLGVGYVGDGVELGMGELIFYSFLPAHVEAYYCEELLLVTLLMVALGVLLNLWILGKRGVIAGLPAPILLGLAPLVIHLIL